MSTASGTHKTATTGRLPYLKKMFTHGIPHLPRMMNLGRGRKSTAPFFYGLLTRYGMVVGGAYPQVYNTSLWWLIYYICVVASVSFYSLELTLTNT